MPKNANMAVNSTDVKNASKTISDASDALTTAYTNVFNSLRSIDAAWDGEDNSEYNENFMSFEKDFFELTKFINRMVNHLELTAKAYETAEAASTKSAQKLSF